MKDCAAIDLQLAKAPLLPDQPAEVLMAAAVPDLQTGAWANREASRIQVPPPDLNRPAAHLRAIHLRTQRLLI